MDEQETSNEQQHQTLQDELKTAMQTLYQRYGGFEDPFSVDPLKFEQTEGSFGTRKECEIIHAVKAQDCHEFLIGMRVNFRKEHRTRQTSISLKILDIDRTELAKSPKHRQTASDQFWELCTFGIRGKDPIKPIKSPDELGLIEVRFDSGRPGFNFFNFELQTNAFKLPDKYQSLQQKIKAVNAPNAQIEVLYKNQSGNIPLSYKPN